MSLIVWSLEDVEKYMQLKEKIGISEVQEDVVPCMYLEQVKIERLVEIATTENRKELAIRIVTNILKPTLDRINPNITEEVLQKLKESEVKVKWYL